MAKTDLVSDDLWEAIQPLLPPEPRQDHGGPARVSHRAALGGILYILRHGLRRCDLPLELGFGSGVTCWRRLRQWQELGMWATLHQVVLNWLGDLDAIDWSRASVDSVSVRAKRSGEHTGPNPTDRDKRGSKYHCENGSVGDGGHDSKYHWLPLAGCPECTIRLPAASGARGSP